MNNIKIGMLGFFLLTIIIPAYAQSSGPFAYIPSGTNLYVINTSTNLVSTFPYSGGTSFVATSSLGRIYVTGRWDVSVIDTMTNNIIKTISIDNWWPTGIAVSPDGSRIYVGYNRINNTSLAIIDASTNEIISQIDVGINPFGVAVDPSGKRVYVVDRYYDTNSCPYPCSYGTVRVVDTTNNSIIAIIPVGYDPLGIAVNPSGTKAYVVGDAGYVYVIDTSTNTVTNTIPTGGISPWGIAVNPAGTRLYVVNRYSPPCCNSISNVAVINTTDNNVITNVEVGEGSVGISVSPDNSKIYVINGGSKGSISVIGADSNTVIDTINMSDPGPWAVGQFILTVPNYNPKKDQAITFATLSGKIYGDSPFTISATSSSGLPVSFRIKSGPATIDTGTNTVTITGTGNVTIEATQAGDNTYNVATPVDQSFDVAKRPITVTADSGQTKVYGDQDPAFTYKINSGSLLNGDSLSGSLTRISGENVGTYAIQIGTLANSNYDINFVGTDFVIAKRPITVIADYGQSKIYGDPDPAFTFNITNGSLVKGDSLIGSLIRASGEIVGIYPLQIGTLSNSNYDITFLGTYFGITPRSITITANAQTKPFGSADPILTYNVTNGSLTFNDTFSGSLTRDIGEDVGIYNIKQGTLLLNNNYVLTYIGDILTINPADTTTTLVSSSNPSILNGSVTFTANVSANLPSTSIPIGNIEFDDGTTILGNVTLISGNASLAMTLNTVGTIASGNSHNITVKYLPGNQNFNPSNNSMKQGVIYEQSGNCNGDIGHAIRQPINPLPPYSTFKKGSTVPTKVAVCDANGNSIGSPGTISSFIQTGSSNDSSDINENIYSTTPDNAFRWDPTGKQWIFNMATNNYISGTYYNFQITFNDGTTTAFEYGIK